MRHSTALARLVILGIDPFIDPVHLGTQDAFAAQSSRFSRALPKADH
jgi:hypothetical protein